MTCASPFDDAVLAGYWTGAMAQPEAELVEEHLFGCGACAARLDEIAALADGVKDVARGGSLMMVVSDAFLQCAAAQGLRIREYAPPRGGSIECTVTADDDLLVGRLAADLRGAARVDLCFCDEGGAERGRLSDIPFRPDAGEVAFQHSITQAKAAASETMVARLVVVDDTGEERPLGEYTFRHTRTLPGPGNVAGNFS